LDFDLRRIGLVAPSLWRLNGAGRLVIGCDRGRLDEGFRRGNRNRFILPVESGGNSGLAGGGTSVGGGLRSLLFAHGQILQNGLTIW
jgi:hypothetical protein